jgi:CheY-like chemotaxis protein
MAYAVRKLLIVEDEPLIRSTLSAIFVELGHEVDSAEDGFSALEKIRQSKPDIILSDLNMPGMSGFELLSVVRRRLPSIYVIATSGAYSGANIPAASQQMRSTRKQQISGYFWTYWQSLVRQPNHHCARSRSHCRLGFQNLRSVLKKPWI